MNVKIAFFYDNVEKEIYIQQFIKYISKKYFNKIYKFNKTFYDLKQFSQI